MNKRGRWTRTPPPGDGPIVAFVYIPRKLNEFLVEHKERLNECRIRAVAPRVAQRVHSESGPCWFVAGSEHAWTIERLELARAVWWSASVNVPLISIDCGVSIDEKID